MICVCLWISFALSNLQGDLHNQTECKRIMAEDTELYTAGNPRTYWLHPFSISPVMDKQLPSYNSCVPAHEPLHPLHPPSPPSITCVKPKVQDRTSR